MRPLSVLIVISTFILLLLILSLRPLAADESDQQACLCQFAAPVYAPIARMSGIEGIVHVRTSIDSSGIPIAEEVLPEKLMQNPAIDILDRAAVEAIKKWRFCRTVGSKQDVVVTVKFRLQREKPITGTDQWYPTEVTFKLPLTIEITTTAVTVPAAETSRNQPVPRHLESMTYDMAAPAARVEGDVDVQLTINDDGSVIAAEAANGPPALRKGAEANALTWKFAPGQAGTVRVTYSFRLEKPYLTYTGPTRTVFDLPNHVTVMTNLKEIAGNSSHQ